jgi:ribonuclease P protein component
MVSVHAWRRNGAARHWPAAERRDGSSSRSVSRTSTRGRKTAHTALGFPRHARITRGAELQRISREGKRIRTTNLEVRAAASPLVRLPGTRMRGGLIVPRFKQSAVRRNRLKRQLRELTRQRLLPADLSADVVLRIRPEAYSATFEALTADVDRALVQLTRWNAADPISAPAPVRSGSPPVSDT